MSGTEEETQVIVDKILNLTKKDVAFGVTQFAVGTSVKLVVSTAIASLVPTETKTQKVKVAIGSYVISSMVVNQAKAHSAEKFNKLTKAASALKKQFKDAVDEAEKPSEDKTETPTQ